ncbi:DEAD/DEAH box helicase [Aquamicrobium segne]|uniref:DEAD/DEAH box helicase n=1 Tax=Aquamicrobium segne TaxID=469547 RepID=A0ABW0H130_9HYPH
MIEGIAPALAKALEKRGYLELTAVQKAVLEPAVKQADALVSAQTGSGKTVAFGLALAPTLLGEAERFGQAQAPLGLVVAPTRELALQVARELSWLYEQTGATIATCVGGMDMRSERRTLERGAHIVVGTPGRLRDHITRGALDISGLTAVVLDEADEMLDLGFREDLEFILGEAPAERRTLMFSATVPRAIATLAKKYQHNAVRIEAAGEAKQHHDIEYRALLVAASDRDNAIVNVLRFYEARNAIVFCNTRAAVNHLTARLNNRNFSVVALSGELSQNERSHALQAMRDGRARVCIATDVAARGIDLPGLELVIHADLPTNPDTLLHRSGRTGRAGRKGISALIVPHPARRRCERVLQAARIAAEWARPPSAEDVIARDNERMLADPALSEPVGESEQEFVTTLLEKFGPQQMAAAYLRQNRSSRSAPEYLSESGPLPAMGKSANHAGTPSRDRDDFGDSVWFSLSVGRKQNAEPRWLIPMLCRTADLTKREIGAIRMQPEETFVQIAANSADSFLQAIGPQMTIQGNIRVAMVEGEPDFGRSAYRTPRPDKKPHRGKGNFTGKDKPWEAKSKAGKPAKPKSGKKPANPIAPAKPRKKPKSS